MSGSIQFSAAMAALLWEGLKTQTRRLKTKGAPGDVLYVKEPWRIGGWDVCDKTICADYSGRYCRAEWVNPYPDATDCEKFEALVRRICDYLDRIAYPETSEGGYRWERGESPLWWNSPRYMPRSLSRMSIKLVDVHEERLCDIGETDANAEGFACVVDFFEYWDKLYSKQTTKQVKANPRVFVHEFVVLKEEK